MRDKLILFIGYSFVLIIDVLFFGNSFYYYINSIELYGYDIELNFFSYVIIYYVSLIIGIFFIEFLIDDMFDVNDNEKE